MALTNTKHVYANPRAHQRRSETAKRLCDKDHPAPPYRLDDAIRVGREACLLVVSGQVDRDRVVPGLFEERHDTMPVPCDTAGTRNENEACHA